MHFTPRWRADRRIAAAASAVLTLAALTVVGTVPAHAAGGTYYVSPSGSDSAAGTSAAPWKTIAHAQSVASAGDTVYFRAGTYAYTAGTNTCSSQTATVNAIVLNKSGTSGNPIRYWAYPGETPHFDFSGMTDDCRVKGFDVTGSYVHLKGLEVTGVPQHNNLNHESWGVWISGGNNTFEQLNLHNNMGPGLFIQDGGGNLVLNCDSHDNYDPLTSNGAGQSADGFGAHISAGHPGNVFRGDRAWWNSDDGFDLINAYSSVTIEDSWTWRNGYLPGTTTSAAAGNGNGFKMGGYGGVYVSNGAKHTLRDSVSFLNKAAGIYANHHTLANDYFNNTSYSNHPDFNMLGINSSGSAVGLGNLRNNIAYGGTLLSNNSGVSDSANSWTLGVTVSDSQFQSVSTSGWDAPRQADGSLPVLPNLRLAAGSSLIDKGVDVGLPYSGSAPDLGAFEYGGTSVTTPATITTSTTTRTTTTSTGPVVTTTTTPARTTTTTTSVRTTTTTGGATTGACTTAFTIASAWSGGFVGNVSVTAGAALSGWKVTLTLPSGVAITSLWGGTNTGTTGTVGVTNAAYNGSLGAGQATSFGFQATGTGSGTTVTCAAA